MEKLMFVRIEEKLFAKAHAWGKKQKPKLNRQQSVESLIRAALNSFDSKKEKA